MHAPEFAILVTTSAIVRAKADLTLLENSESASVEQSVVVKATHVL